MTAGQPQTTKKFRSAAAPKGAKLPEGYVDRAKGRDDQEADDKAERVKSLEEMMKLQQIDEATFISLRDEILGGDVSSTHLVKGLDWKLLERVKRGENVLAGEEKQEDENEEKVDVDDELDELENMEVHAVKKEQREKKGEMAAPGLIPGKKRTRNQILAEMKAQRKAAQEARGPKLDPTRFKKIGERTSQTRIERDSKGREVLITTDEDGNEKRKVRKIQVQPEEEHGHGLLMPDKDIKPLGMEVPDVPQVVEEEADIDIFDDVGDDYDPLAGIDDEEEEEDSEEGEVAENAKEKIPEPTPEQKSEPGSMAPPPRPSQPSAPRNYFGDSKPEKLPDTKPKALSDPTILAALKKASSIAPLSTEPTDAETAARAARHKKMLQQDDRDSQDMDMGFGSSRFEDEEDFSDKKVKLSEWGGKDDGDDDGEKGEKGKRKRGPKKRKGDANSAADVLKVMEQRKAAKS